ncbi:MAG: hypothetical protein K6B14_04065 [Lachnospiraceae bacterium]|nr:hypothetical protein [Lachnospiraceae bacterium]
MYEVKSRVGLDAVGPSGLIGADAILREMVNCAVYQTQDCVYDINEMAKKHRGWFVISWQVRIHGRMKLADALTIQTFPYDFMGFTGKRHFKILSDSGELLVSANSLWTWMDIEKVRPVRIPADFLDLFGQDGPPEEEWPGRKLMIPEDMTERYRFTVSPMFLDTNGHMNNSYYVSAAQKCLPDGMDPRAFYVEYRKQALPDAEVVACSSAPGDEMTVVMYDTDGEVYSVVRFEC